MIQPVRFYEDLTPELQAERDALHDACGAAWEKYGTIRCDAWQEAKRALTAHELKYGGDYNPD
jgi:hypothetical protein